MSEDYYLFVAEGNGKNFMPLNKQFVSLGGSYVGIGHIFPSQKEELLNEIVKHLPDVKIHRMPKDRNQPFESVHQEYNASYLLEKLIKLETEILEHARNLKLNDTSEESITSSCILSDDQKNLMTNLLKEKNKLKTHLDWAVGMGKAISSQTGINIKSLKEIEKDDGVNFLTVEAPPMPRLIDYEENGQKKILIRKGIPVMFAGAGGTGKTHCLTQLALCIASGAPWFGIYPIHESGHVFLGLGENSMDDIHRLVKKTWGGLNKRNPTFPDKNIIEAVINRLSVHSFMGKDAAFVQKSITTSFYESFLNELIKKQPKEGWSCLILDPISRFLGAEAEIDNAAATQFISLLERMILELNGNPTIIFGHHMNKSGVSGINTDQGAARGSSALVDGVRQQFNLEKVKKVGSGDDAGFETDVVNLRMVKSNFTVILEAQKLKKDESGYLDAFYEDVKPIVISDTKKMKQIK